MKRELDAEVFIVGAGPVGLGLAIELGLRSIQCLVIEQNDGVGYSPRANSPMFAPWNCSAGGALKRPQGFRYDRVCLTDSSKSRTWSNQ
ncbi:MAG: FAD-dependent monooxygenase [Pseudomonadota bacterium]